MILTASEIRSLPLAQVEHLVKRLNVEGLHLIAKLRFKFSDNACVDCIHHMERKLVAAIYNEEMHKQRWSLA